MSVHIVKFLQQLKKCLKMISPKHSITLSIEGNAIDDDKLEIRTVLTYHCATYSVLHGPLLIVLYWALAAKALDTPCLDNS